MTSGGNGLPRERGGLGATGSVLVERVRHHLGPLWSLTRMAPTPAHGVRNALIVLLMPLIRRHLQRRGRFIVVPIDVDGGRRDFVVDCMGDLQVLHEIWSWRIYDVAPLWEARTVVDAGANIGAAVAFFKTLRPDAIVHAYEPDPHTFRKLERNVGDMPGVTLHRTAIGGEDGLATLHSSPNSWDSSLVVGAGGGVEVACRQLQTARREAGLERIDLLKLDVEGAEFDVLADGGALDGIRAIVAELHFDFAPQRTLKDVLDACAGFRATVSGDSARRMTMLAVRAQARPRARPSATRPRT
jgi:FkbM family methyltransferase